MRWLAMLLCGCGRLSFDPAHVRDGSSSSEEGGGAVHDAPRYSLDAGECPPQYTAFSGFCYRHVTTLVTWLDAERACEADAEGAHLAVIEDTSEAGMLDSFVSGTHWIGMSDRNIEGAWRVVTGGSPTFFGWAPGEPDGNPEDCVAFSEAGQLYDEPCTALDDYVCEYDGVRAQPSAY